jgi:hypothetical protein
MFKKTCWVNDHRRWETARIWLPAGWRKHSTGPSSGRSSDLCLLFNLRVAKCTNLEKSPGTSGRSNDGLELNPEAKNQNSVDTQWALLSLPWTTITSTPLSSSLPLLHVQPPNMHPCTFQSDLKSSNSLNLKALHLFRLHFYLLKKPAGFPVWNLLVTPMWCLKRGLLNVFLETECREWSKSEAIYFSRCLPRRWCGLPLRGAKWAARKAVASQVEGPGFDAQHQHHSPTHKKEPGMVSHTVIPALERLKLEDFCPRSV